MGGYKGSLRHPGHGNSENVHREVLFGYIFASPSLLEPARRPPLYIVVYIQSNIRPLRAAPFPRKSLSMIVRVCPALRVT